MLQCRGRAESRSPLREDKEPREERGPPSLVHSQKVRADCRANKGHRNTRGRKRRGFHRVEHDDGWALPMPVIDPAIVKRSSRRHEAYGADFRYQQFLRLGSLAQVGGLLGGVAGVFALSQTAMTRRWLLGRRPSGDGPNEEVRAKSFFELTFVGTSERCRVVTRVSGADPGYDETSKMLAEAGVLVATRKEDLLKEVW